MLNANNCWHFNIYEQDKLPAQLSWAWKKFYNLGARSLPITDAINTKISCTGPISSRVITK